MNEELKAEGTEKINTEIRSNEKLKISKHPAEKTAKKKISIAETSRYKA